MFRIVISYIVPLLLPTAVYLAWIWQRNRRLAAKGIDPAAVQQPIPWVLLVGLGVLLIAGLVAVTFTIEHRGTDSVYVPPHMENGQVVPGHMISREPTEAAPRSEPASPPAPTPPR